MYLFVSHILKRCCVLIKINWNTEEISKNLKDFVVHGNNSRISIFIFCLLKQIINFYTQLIINIITLSFDVENS